MRLYCLIKIFAVLSFFTFGNSFAISDSGVSLRLLPAVVQVQEILDVYESAVNDGQVIVFEQVLEANEIIPKRVEISFDLETNKREIRVHANLKQEINLPNVENVSFQQISSVLSENGQIIETIAHILY